MARPAVHATTEALYASLPDVYLTEDEERADGPNGYPLLRFLSLVGDQAGELYDVIEGIDYYAADDGGAPGDTSTLADPATAAPAWLEWLAQIVGVTLDPALDEAGRRAATSTATGGFRAGTRPAIAAAAQTALTGSKYVGIIPHYGGDPWRIEVRVRTPELVSTTAAVAAAIIDKGAKPAGAEIVVTTTEATWATLEANRTTWAAWDATWVAIEETGL